MVGAEVAAGLRGRAAPASPRHFLRWPGWGHLGYAALLSVANTLWFGLVYGGADALTAKRSLRVPVHIPVELQIPLVPAMTLAYMSLYPLLLLAPFVLRARRELRAFVLAVAVAILCGGIGFLLVPAELAFAPATAAELGRWQGLFQFADELNLTYNLVPSLHVTFAVLCAAAFAPRAAASARVVLWSWTSLIAASTVLTHQHHLLDVLTGWLLGLGCAALVFRRLAR